MFKLYKLNIISVHLQNEFFNQNYPLISIEYCDKRYHTVLIVIYEMVKNYRQNSKRLQTNVFFPFGHPA